MDFKTFINNYKNVVIIGIVAIGIFGFLLSKIIPTVMNLTKINKDYSTAKTSVADKERLLKDLQEKAQKQAEGSDEQLEKPFFRAIDSGLDTEAVIANEFGEIIMLLRSNSIKARSVEYEYDPQDDNFVKIAGDKFNVAKLNIEMIGTYKNFESLLKEMFKHEHFLDIVSFEIVPYSKNKRILIIKMQLKLYAQKD